MLNHFGNVVVEEPTETKDGKEFISLSTIPTLGQYLDKCQAHFFSRKTANLGVPVALSNDSDKACWKYVDREALKGK